MQGKEVFNPTILLIFAVIAIGLPAGSSAQDDYLGQELDSLASPTPVPTAPVDEPSFTQLSVRMFIVLIIIVGLIILLGFGMRKFLKGKRFRSGKIANVLSVTHVVDRKYIAVVEVLGRTLIVGIGADSVTLLSDIGPELPIEPESAAAGGSVNPERDAADFSELLADRLEGMESAKASSFLDDLTDQVKKKISRLEE